MAVCTEVSILLQWKIYTVVYEILMLLIVVLHFNIVCSYRYIMLNVAATLVAIHSLTVKSGTIYIVN